MCGIVGYIGKKQAAPIILDGLAKLEYRGYDSAGLAVRDGSRDPIVVKERGKLSNLVEMTNCGKTLIGTCGIGHTRWATHGEPSKRNAHPHVSGNAKVSGSGLVEGNIVGVHNGIIENYTELRLKLEKKGYVFYSDTDSEVLVKLIDYYYKKYFHTPVDAIAKTMVRVRGSYALEVMFKEYPGEIWVARKDSPIIVGVNKDEGFVASDVPAILKFTRDVYYIDNLEIGCVRGGEVHFYNLSGDEVQKETTRIEWDVTSAEKCGYEYFMMKEIHEQPEAVQNTLNSLVKDGHVDLTKCGLTDEVIKGFNEIICVACGSAWHTAKVNQYIFEDLAKIPVRCDIASEFRYRKPIMSKDTLLIVISQSGETADTLAALRLAKENGVKTLAIVNVQGSSIAREADYVLYTLAGPEIAVATTKAYSAQLIALYCLALKFASIKQGLDDTKYIAELNTIPAKIEQIITNPGKIQWLASKIVGSKDVYFIGRGIDYATCLEGSLKLKEISYIHSEAYAAGELKHGTISLIEEGTLVIGLLTQSEVIEKTLSNLAECKARGAYLMGVTNYGNYQVEDTLDFVFYVPQIDEHFAASLAIIPLQLLSYYVSAAKGFDVDKPRNLAKSVTVE